MGWLISSRRVLLGDEMIGFGLSAERGGTDRIVSLDDLFTVICFARVDGRPWYTILTNGSFVYMGGYRTSMLPIATDFMWKDEVTI